MLSTPISDYKQAANQTTSKARAAFAGISETRSHRKAPIPSYPADQRSRLTKDANIPPFTAGIKGNGGGEKGGRSGSVSSAAGLSGLTAVTSSDIPSTDAMMSNPFSRRHGRRFLRDPTLPYSLPCDLPELHRQTLRTMLLCQVFNGPVCSPAFNHKPPKRVLDVACGTGFWSAMCHRHYSNRGFSSISFTGIDIAPLAPRMDADDMNWRFVQHDLRRTPLPFPNDEFNLIMIKDLSLVTPSTDLQQQNLMEEYLRVLKPGGTLEIWDGDHFLRMLLPHSPPSLKDGDSSEDEEQVHTNAMGTYTLTPQTPMAEPHNQYLTEYNTWISKALEARKLTPMPCTAMLHILLQESEKLTEIDSRRLAIPLGEVRWEREGVGGAMTSSFNGTHAHGFSSKGKMKDPSDNRKVLTAGQAALRRTALMTVVQMIESLEPLLREASGKGQDEWDRWQGAMMNDLMKGGGTSWGECLEVGAWWARKRKGEKQR